MLALIVLLLHSFQVYAQDPLGVFFYPGAGPRGLGSAQNPQWVIGQPQTIDYNCTGIDSYDLTLWQQSIYLKTAKHTANPVFSKLLLSFNR
jgi:hypothetical protein